MTISLTLGNTRLPFAHGGGGYSQPEGKLILGQALGPAQGGDVRADLTLCSLHIGCLSFLNSAPRFAVSVLYRACRRVTREA